MLHLLPPSAFDTYLNGVVAEEELYQEFLVLLVVVHVASVRRSWSIFTMPNDLLGALGLCASLHGEAGLGGSLGQSRNVPLGNIAVGLLNVIDVGDPLWNRILGDCVRGRHDGVTESVRALVDLVLTRG